MDNDTGWPPSEENSSPIIFPEDINPITPPLGISDISSPYLPGLPGAPPPPARWPGTRRKPLLVIGIILLASAIILVGGSLAINAAGSPHSKTASSMTQTATDMATATAQAFSTNRPTSSTYPPVSTYPPTSTTVPGGPTPSPYPTYTPYPSNTPSPQPTATPVLLTVIDAMSSVPDPDWYQSSGSNNFMEYTVGPVLDGIARNTGITDGEWAEWHYNNLQTFDFIAYYCTDPAHCGFPGAIRAMQITYSSDGVTWSNPTVSSTYVRMSNRPAWTRARWTGSLPQGANYIRITWPDNPAQASWNPILGNAVFSYLS